MLDMVDANPCVVPIINRDFSILINNDNGVNKIVWGIFRVDSDLVRDRLPVG